ncbi:MAG: hypothetical protein HQ503_17260 [Rhodospirillales bacterium]|nr:hypothetical protein [Rhodospirillales bacterium]
MVKAARILLETLQLHQVDRVFCVPGESYLSLIDAFYDADDIDVVTSRHESGATLMAVADAKITGHAGVAAVSRGPGATNASIGIHVAQQDAVPLVLLVGQVARQDLGREAFQEVDYRQTFGDMAKWVVEVDNADKLAESVRRAFHIACSGTPGPVVISLPEDMLDDETNTAPLGPSPTPISRPAPDQVSDLCDRISRAERPLIIAGGQAGSEEGRRALRAVSEAWNVPVAVSFRHQDLFDNTHPNFSCHLGFNMPAVFRDTLNEADLVVAIGTRLGDVTTQGYTIPAAPKPRQSLVHVYPDPHHLGRVFETELAIAADATETLAAMATVNAPEPPPGRADWLARAHDLSARFAEWSPKSADDGVVFGNLVSHLGECLEEDAFIAVDAGNFSTWVHRLFPFKSSNTFVGAVAGAMGMGVPGAVASGLRANGRQVVCFVGDGGFQMTGNEISVAVERKLPIRIFVSNNGSLGTIRLYQEKSYPGRTIATELPNPDFAKLAEAFGAKGLKIDSDADIAPVTKEALATDGPVLIEVRTSLEYIAAYVTMTDIRG